MRIVPTYMDHDRMRTFQGNNEAKACTNFLFIEPTLTSHKISKKILTYSLCTVFIIRPPLSHSSVFSQMRHILDRLRQI